MLGDGFGKFFRGSGTGRCKGDVYVLEIVVVLKFFHYVFLAAESVCTASAALRAEQREFRDWKILFVENSEEFLANGAAGPYNSYSHFSSVLSSFCLCFYFPHIRKWMTDNLL